jgi:hypothetical protein
LIYGLEQETLETGSSTTESQQFCNLLNFFPFSVASGMTARQCIVNKDKYYVSKVQIPSRL